MATTHRTLLPIALCALLSASCRDNAVPADAGPITDANHTDGPTNEASRDALVADAAEQMDGASFDGTDPQPDGGPAGSDGGPSMDASLPAACTIFVALDGNDDNSGDSPRQALRSPSAAVSAAAAGDVVCFGPGEYVGTETREGALHIDEVDGRAGAPITFRSTDATSRAVFSLGGVAAGGRVSAIFLQRSSYIVIDNLEATDAKRGLTGNGVHHIVVRNCYVHHVGGELVFFGRSAGRIDLSNPVSHDIEIVGNEIGHSGLDGGFGEGIYIATSRREAMDDTHNILIQRNEIHHVVDEAIEVKTGGHAVQIIENTIHDVDLNSQAAITLAIHGYSWEPGAFVVRANKITRVVTHGSEGVGIWIGHGNTLVEDNIIWDVEDWGIYIPNTFNMPGANQVTLRRNTIFRTGRQSIEWGRPWNAVPNNPPEVDLDVSNETWDGQGDSTPIDECPACTL